MNKINIHIPQKFFRLLAIPLFLLSSNILYSQYYSCTSANPCPDISDLEDYTPSGHEWDKSVLKYYFINGTDDISGDGERTAFYTAFEKWSNVIPIRFEEVFTQSDADIKIRFASISEWESTGVSSVAFAISYFPEQNCKGNIVLNDNKVFSLNPSSSQIDIYYVALHEVGHALGLCHSSNSAAVMYYNGNGGVGKRSLHSYDIQGIQLIYPPMSVTAQNNFDGGSIYVNIFSTAKTAPYNFTIETGDEVEVSLGAIEQNDGTYDRIWNDNEAPLNLSTWVKETSLGGRSDKSFSQNYTFDAEQDDNNSTYEAGLRKIFNVSFSNQFSGASGGQIKVNGGDWENAPTVNYPTVEQNLIYAQAKSPWTINGISYDFQKWSNNSTSLTTNFYPNQHANYKAIYRGTPLFDEQAGTGNLRNMSITPTSPHGYVKLTWDDHPHTGVTQYRIYRSTNRGTSFNLIGTRNRGNTQFIDYSYEYNTDGDQPLIYDVKAYFSLDGTQSGPNPVTVFGDASNTGYKISSDEAITYYDISNYPNPYNPQTTIQFQLPQEGFVTIKVYNSLGEEINTLLNEKKDYGMYELKFDGSDLPSGIYIYTIQVNDYYASRKMVIVK